MEPQQPNESGRLTQVETLLSHLQHDVDKLNEALINQQSQIDEVRQLITKVEAVIDQLPEPEPDPAHERPPHY